MTKDIPVWYCIPSARHDGGTLRNWRKMGYKVAVQRAPNAPILPADAFDMVISRPYESYTKAVNLLCRTVCVEWPDTLICVTGGDDIYPDPTHSPFDIQKDFIAMIRKAKLKAGQEIDADLFYGMYGVMQPTGDRWASDDTRSDRIAYSPWLGRDWILKANQGQGPLHPDYFHFYEDEHLQNAAIKQGVFWQRPDLTQYHDHWTRNGSKRPDFLIEADNQANKDKQLFERHKANGFAESFPTMSQVKNVL